MRFLNLLVLSTYHFTQTAATKCDPSKCSDHNFFVHTPQNCKYPRTLLTVQDTEFPCCTRTECICQTSYLIHKSSDGVKESKTKTRTLVKNFQNCTIIDGSIALKHNFQYWRDHIEGHNLTPSEAGEYLSKIFENIREVWGSIMIFEMDHLKYLEFRNLRIIRGQMSSDKSEMYNPMHAGSMTFIKDNALYIIRVSEMDYVGFPKLMEISNGNVTILPQNYNMKMYCYFKRIKFKDEIFPIGSNQVLDLKPMLGLDNYDCEKNKVIKCHTSCKTAKSRLAKKMIEDYKETISFSGVKNEYLLDRCWSDKKEHCQEFRITFCGQACSNPQKSCYFKRDMKTHSKCCNDRCGAGCGSEGSNCNTCGYSPANGEYINRNGVCEQKATCKNSIGLSKNHRSQNLMKSTQSGVQYKQYLRYCLEDCPENYPSDGTSCIKQCARNYDVDESENACVECKKGKKDVNDETDWCYEEKKLCRIYSTLDTSLNRATPLKDLISLPAGCKILDGSLNLNQNSWTEDIVKSGKPSYKKHQNVRTVIEKLKNIEVITGYLTIATWPEDLNNFCPFQNLKVIKGRELNNFARFDDYKSLALMNTNPVFNDFCLYNLTKIDHGNIYINDQSKTKYLFPGSFDQWTNMMKGPDKIINIQARDLNVQTGKEGTINRYKHLFKCDQSCNSTFGCYGYSNMKKYKDKKIRNLNCVRCADDYVTEIDFDSEKSALIRRNQKCLKFCEKDYYPKHEQVFIESPVNDSYSRRICTKCDNQCLKGCTDGGEQFCKGLDEYRYIPIDSEGEKIKNLTDFQGVMNFEYQKNSNPGCKNAVRVLYPYYEIDSAASCSEDCKGNFTSEEVEVVTNKNWVFFTDYTEKLNLGKKSSNRHCFQCHPSCIGKCDGIAEVDSCSECSMVRTSFKNYKQKHSLSKSITAVINYQNETGNVEDSDLEIVDIKGNHCLLYKSYDIPEIKYCFEKNVGNKVCGQGCQLLINKKPGIPEKCDEKLQNCKVQKYNLIKCIDPKPNSSKTTVLVAIVLFITFLPIICLVHIWYKGRVKRLKKGIDTALTGNHDLDQSTLLTTQNPTGEKPNTNILRVVKERELQFSGKLGSGAFGDVYRALWCPSLVRGEKVKILVAVKVIKGKLTQEASKEMLDEAKVMASINSPWLVKLLGIAFGDKVMMISSFMPGGALNDYLKSNQKSITAHNMMTWCHQIAKGMQYLESIEMVHRDLATRNVLVKNVDHVKITDFGLAKMLERSQGGCYRLEGGERMAIKWLAPECLRHKIFSRWSDVWAYGITVWEILTFGGRPWQDVKISQILEKLESGERLEQPNTASLDFWMFLVRCWLKKPEDRISFKGIVEEIDQMAYDSRRYILVDPENYNNNRGYTSQSSYPGENGVNNWTKDSWMKDLGLDAKDLMIGENIVGQNGNVLVDPTENQIEEYLKPEDVSGSALQQAAYTGGSINVNNISPINSQPTMPNDVFERSSSITNNATSVEGKSDNLYENTNFSMPSTASYPASYRSPFSSIASAKTSNTQGTYYNNSLAMTSVSPKTRRNNLNSETQRPLLASEEIDGELEYNLANSEKDENKDIVQIASQAIPSSVYKSLEDVQEIEPREINDLTQQQSSGFNSDSVPEYQNANIIT